MSDILEIGGERIQSRLITGSGKYSDPSIIPDVLRAAECDIITVALRRVDISEKGGSIISHIPKDKIILPNTSGARDADEAVRIARLSREIGCGRWIKIEVIRDTRYLMPDNAETLRAVETLAKEDFIVLPYMVPDPAAAKRMSDAGASGVMPLGSPIGSNKGVRAEDLISIMIEQKQVPLIVDAGIGRPSDAAYAMEMGADAVLLNTAIASSPDPVRMAGAFRRAVVAGREAFLSGLAVSSDYASPSSPLTGFLDE